MLEFDEIEEIESEERDGFSIKTDDMADWAIGKIKEEKAEADRLLDLIKKKREDLEHQEQQIRDDYERRTSFLRMHLQMYMETVKAKETKTQKSYKLLSGSLVMKKPSTVYVHDDEALVAWLEANGFGEQVKIKKTPAWADIKPILTSSDGKVVIALTGEVVDGVTVQEVPGKFEVK